MRRKKKLIGFCRRCFRGKTECSNGETLCVAKCIWMVNAFRSGLNLRYIPEAEFQVRR